MHKCEENQENANLFGLDDGCFFFVLCVTIERFA
jgi:hypothetical protein